MKVCVFIAVFCSSIVGAQVFGVSLNKLALIPLEIYLLVQNTGGFRCRIDRRQKNLLIWYVIASVSSISGIIFSLCYNTNIIYELLERALLDITSYLLMFIPIALLIWNSKKQAAYFDCFKSSLIATCRIQALWGIAQFVLMYTIDFDLNSKILGTLFGGSWTGYSNLVNSTGGSLLRVTGINHDSAFLGLLLIIGIIVDSNVWFKLVYLFCAIFSSSRATLVSIAFFMLYLLVIKLRRVSKSNPKKVRKYILMILLFIFLGIYIYQKFPSVKIQVYRVIERFATISTGEDGTGRHSGYPIATVYLELFKIPIIQKLFGVGNQCGGILMTYFQDSLKWLGLAGSMKDLSNIWTVESDFASVFLETGLLGGFFYYKFMYSIYKHAGKDTIKRSLVITLVFFGVMYNMAGAAFIQLVYISLYASNYSLTESKEVLNYGSEQNETDRKSLYSLGKLL
jgi:hypothetical protein